MSAKLSPVNKRIQFFILMIFLHLGVIGRVAYIQIDKGDFLRKKIQDQVSRQIELMGRRGTIYDRKGKMLAVDVRKTSVYADMMAIRKQKKLDLYIDKLSKPLGIPKAELRKMMTTGENTVWLAERLDYDKAQKLRAYVNNKDFKLTKIGFREETIRSYPNGESAASLIGFMGRDKGMEGSERAFEQWLWGGPGYVYLGKDGTGRNIPNSTRKRVEPRIGSDVYLTIDMKIQHFAESAIKNVMATFSPSSVTAVVLEAKTGRVLAMADAPTYNPNSFREYDASNFHNRAIWRTFEPGSIMKPITAAACFDSGTVDPFKDKFYCPATIFIGSKTVGEHEGAKTNVTNTPTDIIANSSNVGTALMALKMGGDNWKSYINKFHFGQTYGLPLNGESRGLLQRAEHWSDLTTANVGFGQGISVTAFQMIMAYSVFANDGILLKPAVVQKIVDADGQITNPYHRQELRRVIKPETAKVVRYMLHQVVERGTGEVAQIDGFTVGGKTGTAQIAEGGVYISGAYNGSFVGMAPISDPRIIVLVTVEKPAGSGYGSVVAAPAFKEIMQKTLWYMDIKPDHVKKGGAAGL